MTATTEDYHMTMNRIVKFFLFFILALPVTSLAQDKVLKGTVEIPDEDYSNGKFESLYRNIRIYSCMSLEDAKYYLKEFNEGKKGFNLDAIFFKEKKTPNSNYDFEILTRSEGGAVLLLCGDNMYKSTYFPITKNTNRIRFVLERITDSQKKGKNEYSNWDGPGGGIQLADTLTIRARVKTGPIIRSRSLDLDGYLRIVLEEAALALNYRDNSRIVAQPYWLDGPDWGENKVFAYAKPVVLDLNEYDCTQTRRMNFDKLQFDSLSGFFVGDSTEARIITRNDSIFISLQDTVSGYNPDESYPYPARVIVCAEDYNERYFMDTLHIDEGERVTYMKFLDFKYDKDFDLNWTDFKEVQSVSKMPSPPIEKQLNFNASQATINYRDTMNTRLLKELEYEFTHLCDGDGVILKQMQVTGFASPDGVLEDNKKLARQRAEFALSLVRNNLPLRFRNNIYDPKSEVRGWDEVEKMLRQDSLYSAADVVKTIIEAHPGDLSKQYNSIKNCGYYDLIRERKYLDRLRSVRFDYVLLQDRTKSSQEIRQEFELGLDKDFSRAQYWELLRSIANMSDTISGKAELLEEVSRRAYENQRYSIMDNWKWGYKDTVYNDGRWALAANIYATCLINREVSDLTILAPFINTDKVIDDSTGVQMFAENLNIVMREEADGVKDSEDADSILPPAFQVVNNENMIANQIIMLISKGSRKYRTILGDLTNLLTQGRSLSSLDDKKKKLIALANCSRGRWMEGSDCSEEEARLVRNIVSDISTTNNVIINIAMADYKQDTKALNSALSMMNDLPKNSAVSSYLKAILELMRKPIANKEKSAEYLADAFMLDITKIPIANNDRQLIAPDMTKIKYRAFEEWERRTNETATISVMRPLNSTDSLAIEGYKANGTWEEKKDSYMIKASDQNHPYTWYKTATFHVIGKNKLEDINLDSLNICLEKCIDHDPNYLSVIRVAGYIDNEVKNSKLGRMLFDEFYLNESRKREK